MGITTQAVYRRRRVGLDVWAADRWACAIGLHPTDVWPDWGQEW